MKIAMIGHKDFPCRTGGVEVVVYELATRLAARGEDVTVYNRGKIKGRNKGKELGVNIRRSFTFKKQSLNAMVYSFTATFNALFHNYDIIHYHAIGPSVPLFVAHLFGKKTVSTIHGLNWKVDKWNSFACKYLKLGERIAAKYADEVVTLSDEMYQYFLDTYNRKTVLIKNAISPIPTVDDKIIFEKFGLKKNSYILYVGRISPEKGIQDLIAAYNKIDIPQKLVIVGEISENEFGNEIKELIKGNDKIICTGFAEGERLYSLYNNCALYVLPSHTEGLALTLLEAMSCGVKCLVSDIVENMSVIKDYGYSFRVSQTDDLAEKIVKSILTEGNEAKQIEEITYIKDNYSYDNVIDKHLQMYKGIIGKK